MRNLKQRLEWARDNMEPRPTIQEIADGCRVKRAGVHLWFNGTTTRLKPETYWAAAKFFRVDRDWLETGIGDPRTGAAKEEIAEKQSIDIENQQVIEAFSKLSPAAKVTGLAMLHVLQQTSDTQPPGRPGVVNRGDKKNEQRVEAAGPADDRGSRNVA